jgi:quercetin dioxygenase-like cupin family protein
MRQARLSQTEARSADPSHFTGDASRHDLIVVDSPPSSALLVRFAPGGRTHWHRHPDGQYLYVVEGRGWVQSRGHDAVSVQAGDCVYAAPGEEHWHGADATEGVAHLAFSFGITEWIGPTDDQ